MNKFNFKYAVTSLLIAVASVSFSHEHEKSELAFVKNNGQWSSQVEYRADVANGRVFLEKGTFTFVQLHPADLDAHHDMLHESRAAYENFEIRGHAWKTHFLGANASPSFEELEKRTEYHNYYIGDDRSKWATAVPLFNEIGYTNLYPGIDLLVYSVKNNFKYDFIVHANTAANQIQLQYEGLNSLQLIDGNLVLATSVGEFSELKPFAYQIIDGKKIEIACNYILNGTTVSFDFPDGYDKNVDLIIDPVLVAATLSSSSAENYGHSATFDNDGNIYTGARNFGPGYPATVGVIQNAFAGGGTDIAISKISPNGTALIYASYLGGSGSEYPHSMIVNGNNELFVLGTTNSNNFPTTVGAFDVAIGGTQDMIITHFSSDATSLIGSTYMGGNNQDGSNNLSTNYGDDFRGEIVLDPGGNCLVASCTNSANFPTTTGAHQTTFGSGAQDGVVFKMNPTLSVLEWSTYIGGGAHDVCYGVRVDDNLDVFVSGATSSGFFTGTGHQTTYQGGPSDGFVMKLESDGSSVLASSYWGTSNRDNAFFIALGVDDGVYLYGQCDGGGSPVSSGVFSNPGSAQFICKLTPMLTAVSYSTVIGSGSGSVDFIPIAFMVDNCDYVYFSGHSGIGGVTSLPTTVGALQTSGGFYLGVLDPGGVSMNYATHYGGLSDHVDGGTSRFDPAGIVYQGVCTNNGFNTTVGAVDASYPGPGDYDIGVFKIDFQVNPLYAQAAADPSLTGCAPFMVDFQNTSSGGTYTWIFGDGTPNSTAFEPSHTFTNPGTYTVTLIAFDPAACNQYDTSYVIINVGSSSSPTADFTYSVNCATQSITLTYTGTPGAQFSWDMGDGTILSGSPVSHFYGTNGSYTVTLTAGDGICAPFSQDSENISISAAPITPLFNDPTCYAFSDGSIVLNVSGGTGLETFSILNSAGTELIIGSSNVANNLPAGWYYYFVDLGNGCATADSVELVNPFELQAGLNITHVACNGDATGIVIVDTVYNWQGSYGAISFIWGPTNPCSHGGIGADSCFSYLAGNYVLTINDGNGCSNVVDFTVNQPTPLVLSQFGMESAQCRLYPYQSGNGVVYAAATGGTSDYDYLWTNLSTGQTSTNTTWGGLNPATYQIQVTDNNGCILIQTIVLDSLNPIADFTMTSPQFDVEWEGTAPVTIHFENQSLYYANANDPTADTTFFWNFNYDNIQWVVSHNLSQTFDTTYTSAGIYTICIVALNKNGCTDTLCTDIIIYDPFEFKPVNIFTPDGDGFNDEFTFRFLAVSVETFSCVIVNRWGVTVAEFDDISDSWDGKDKGGQQCKDGVYFYVYEGTSQNVDATGSKIPFKGQGTVTIVATP